MIKDLFINKRNIIFLILSSVFVLLLNLIFLNNIDVNEQSLNVYNKLNFDFVAESNIAYSNDDCYYPLDDYFYTKKDNEYTLIDSNLFMKANDKNQENPFYENLIKDNSDYTGDNSVIISEFIASKFGLKLDDKLYDIDDNIYQISCIIENIDNLFGEETKINSVIIINYEENRFNEKNERYINFCNYNQNLYSDILFSKKNLIIDLSSKISSMNLFYYISMQIIALFYIVFCFYQYSFDKSFYAFGFEKKAIILQRIISLFIDFVILFIIGILPIVFLRLNVINYILSFLISPLLILFTHVVIILKMWDRKRYLKNV